MNLYEAKKILNRNGFRLIKEGLGSDDSFNVDSTFVNNLIDDIKSKILDKYCVDSYDSDNNCTVRQITLNTNINPIMAICIDFPALKKPSYIIGFRKAEQFDSIQIFKCKDRNDTRIRPLYEIPINNRPGLQVLDIVYNEILDLVDQYVDSITLIDPVAVRNARGLDFK